MKFEDLKECDLKSLQDCYEAYVEEHPLESISFRSFVEQIIYNVKEVEPIL